MKPDRDLPRAHAFCPVCDDHRALSGGETCPACHGMLGDPLRPSDPDDEVGLCVVCLLWILALVLIGGLCVAAYLETVPL